ncbi:TadE family type IV pilus minor pilin [Microbispora sp. NBRC 16548]|uniref:TadE family type IV pilus minor pilin n=1 Tax=Microbispora sp. NBRC 16548 TaxID=3030994 RepID=UPI00331C475D
MPRRRVVDVPPRRERGSVTAETAVALPALVVVLTASLWAVTIVGAQLRCVDAARAGARAAARGEAAEEVSAAVLRLAPEGAMVSIRVGADTTRVEVIATVRPPFRSPLPPARLRAAAVSATEPGVLPSLSAAAEATRSAGLGRTSSLRDQADANDERFRSHMNAAGSRPERSRPELEGIGGARIAGAGARE